MVNIGDINNLLKQAQNAQQKMTEMENKLKNAVFVGVGGSDELMATVEISGNYHLRSIKLGQAYEEALGDNATLLVDVLIAAFRSAVRKVQESYNGSVSDAVADMGLNASMQDMQKMLGGLLGGMDDDKSKK